MQKIQKRTGRRTFWCGKAPGVPEFSTLKKFWQKTLRRWSNVTCVQEWDTLTCLERKCKERNIRKKTGKIWDILTCLQRKYKERNMRKKQKNMGHMDMFRKKI